MRDALGRQLRWRDRNPQDPCPGLTPRVLKVFQVLERHGHLPSNYLHAIVGGDSDRFIKLLARLYDWGYLDRFQEQENSFPNRIRHIVYGNTEKARKALDKACFVDRNDRFVHRLFNACVGASIELGTTVHGITYIPRNEILKGKSLRIALGERAYLEPDDLFGFQYPDKTYRRFAVEIDRATEPEEGKDRNSSIEKKFDYYEDVIANRRYLDAWGIKNLMLLFVTTSLARIENVKALATRYPKVSERLLLKGYREFTRDWRVPNYILSDVLDPWDSVRGPFNIHQP